MIEARIRTAVSFGALYFMALSCSPLSHQISNTLESPTMSPQATLEITTPTLKPQATVEEDLATPTRLESGPLTYETLAVSESSLRTEKICDDYGDIFFFYSGPIFNRRNQTLQVMNQDGDGRFLVAENIFDTFGWSNDGYQLATVCGEDIYDKNICILEFDKEGACLASQVTVQYELPAHCYEVDTNAGPFEVDFRAFSWSPDGTQIAFVFGESRSSEQVCIMDLDGDVMCWNWQEAVVDVDWSPTSEQLVVADINERIYLTTAKGEIIRQITTGESPRWSPDGSRIAFIKKSQASEGELLGWGIAVVDADGSNERWLFKPFEHEEHERLWHDFGLHWMAFHCPNTGNYCRIAWSPDQKYLVFSSNVGNMSNVQLIRLDLTSGEVYIYPDEVCDPTCSSPDWRP
jgi:Tol biopolymer transport system component